MTNQPALITPPALPEETIPHVEPTPPPEAPTQRGTMFDNNDPDLDEIREAIDHVDPDSRDNWLKIGMALHSTGLGDSARAVWDEWSSRSQKFDPEDQERTWNSFKDGGGVSLGMLYHLAKEGGWTKQSESSVTTGGEHQVDDESPSDSWEKPEPLETPDHKPISFDMTWVPELWRAWIKAIARDLYAYPYAIALALMVVFSGVVCDRAKVHPKRYSKWSEFGNLSGLIAAKSGSMKSPIMKEALMFLIEVHEKAREEFNTALSAWQERTEGEETKQDPKPKRSRYFYDDATIEPIPGVVEDSGHGGLLFQDEATGWLANMTKETRKGERAFWLSALEGKLPKEVLRQTREGANLDHLAMAFLAGIQVGPFTQMIRDAASLTDKADGLFQRMQLLVHYDPPEDYEFIDEPMDEATEESVRQSFEYATTLMKDGEPTEFRFDEQAQQRYAGWAAELTRDLRKSSNNYPDEYVSHLEKHRGTVPKLAMLIHIAEMGTGPIPLRALEMAIGWHEFLRSHLDFFLQPGVSPAMKAAALLYARLLNGEIKDGMTAREIGRNQWAGLPTTKIVEDGLAVLETKNLVRRESSGKKIIYRITPRLDELKGAA